MSGRHLRPLIGLFLLAGCVSTPPHARYAATAPEFSPVNFFEGRTVGEGELKIDFSKARHTHVVGEGTVDADGTLVLVQHVTEGGKPQRTRTWHIRRDGTNRYTGDLTDAIGPVTATVRGNLLDITYTIKHGLDVEQWLYLQPGSGSAINRMVVKKFGIPIASLRETIVK